MALGLAAEGSGAGSQSHLVFPAGPLRDIVLRLEVPESMVSSTAYQHFALLQFINSLCGLIVGLVCIVEGIMLFLHGVAGETGWTAKTLGAESQLSDAAPGVVLFLVGLVVLVTRSTIRARK